MGSWQVIRRVIYGVALHAVEVLKRRKVVYSW